MFYGEGQTLRGKAIYTNGRGMDVTPQFVMIRGALFLATAIFPGGRIRFLSGIIANKRNTAADSCSYDG